MRTEDEVTVSREELVARIDAQIEEHEARAERQLAQAALYAEHEPRRSQHYRTAGAATLVVDVLRAVLDSHETRCPVCEGDHAYTDQGALPDAAEEPGPPAT